MLGIGLRHVHTNGQLSGCGLSDPDDHDISRLIWERPSEPTFMSGICTGSPA
jgi:hypothetical protein